MVKDLWQFLVCSLSSLWGVAWVERRSLLFCSFRVLRRLSTGIFCSLWSLKRDTGYRLALWVEPLYSCFWPAGNNVTQRLPSFSFSSVFYGLRSFVVKSRRDSNEIRWSQSMMFPSVERSRRRYLELWILHLVLRLVQLRMEGSVGDPVRAVGHQQHRELELGHKLSCSPQTTPAGWWMNRFSEDQWQGDVDTHLPCRGAHWRAAAARAWRTPPRPAAPWPRPQTPCSRKGEGKKQKTVNKLRQN